MFFNEVVAGGDGEWCGGGNCHVVFQIARANHCTTMKWLVVVARLHFKSSLTLNGNSDHEWHIVSNEQKTAPF